MKKNIVILEIFLWLFLLTGCGDKKETTKESNTNTNSRSDKSIICEYSREDSNLEEGISLYEAYALRYEGDTLLSSHYLQKYIYDVDSWDEKKEGNIDDNFNELVSELEASAPNQTSSQTFATATVVPDSENYICTTNLTYDATKMTAEDASYLERFGEDNFQFKDGKYIVDIEKFQQMMETEYQATCTIE